MFNRPFNTVLARLGLVAAILATVLILAPAATAATSVSYAENDTAPVATFSATDQDGDAIVWSLGGPDAGKFDIDGGVLTFKSPPNYESPDSKSVGTRADKNVYNVKVQATGGSEDVVVTVTNVDEDGSVSFDGLGRFQPQVGRDLEADLDDPDGGETDEAWQWARSMDMQTWTDIDGATTAKRSPAAADEGYYLRASVTYTDIFSSGKSASKVTGNSVEERTVSNAAPSFADQDDRFDDPDTEDVDNPGTQVNREVGENLDAGMNIGKPVSASDGDNDTLVYTLSGTVPINNVDTAATSLFGIVASSGQLKTKAKLNFEGVQSGGDATNPTDNLYSVMVTATDPSGADTSQPVMITLTDANEAPAFEEGADVPKVLNITENDTTNQLRVGATGGDDLDDAAYNADDEDVGTPDAFPAEDGAALTLSGADAKYFDITDAGALTIDQDTNDDDTNDHTVNFEAKSSYSIAIVATSGAGDRTRRSRLEVTVNVIDAEDGGSVSLNALEPQVGRTVVASVSDDDGGVTLSRWTWATSEAVAEGVSTCDPTATFMPVSPDVSSGAYTPKAADAGKCLRATATYTDNIAGDSDPADTTDNDNDDATEDNMDGIDVSKVSQKPVQTSNAANTAPKFPDQDLTTVGDQSDSASRSVVENKAKENVGGPIFATDSNTDAMLYTVNGVDAASFKTDNSGQIMTKVELDFETKDTYMVALTATDPSGANDTIMVTITVTDGNDDADITGSTAEDYAENGTDPVATFTATDQDGDDIVWSLDGADKKLFNIDGGVLSFEAAPNYEGPKSASIGTRADRNVYNVKVQATGGSHAVVVTVVNVDEDGSVSFEDLGQVQPQTGRSLEAILGDPDMGETDEAWQWARSMDMQTWTDIDGGTSAKRTPVAADEGHYLRATVTYTDIFGPGKTASKVTANAVEERTVANAAPSFADQDETTGEAAEDPNEIVITREVDENTATSMNVGKPVSASDADGDVLVYTLGGVDGASFGISSSTGQIKTKAALDFEADVPTDDMFSVTVTATDPSGAVATETVTIELKDVNEAAKFDTDTTTDGNQAPPATLNVVENLTQLRVGSGAVNLDNTAYAAADEDADTLDAASTLMLDVMGADAKYFEITDQGALTIVDADEDTGVVAHTPDYETKSSYSITIVATSGADDRLLRSRLDVTVNVMDAEDEGSVSFTVREPQVGRTVVATVSDEDGGVALRSWTWATQEGTEATGTAPPSCPTDGTWEVIDGETSGAYTPKLADVGDCLQATATYTDNIAGDGNDDADDGNMEMVSEVTERPVQDSSAANTAPKFPDQDLAAEGDQSDEAMREVDENKNKENVGGPIFADDGDGDALMYGLSGGDAASFSVDNNGQIKTKVELDFEAKDEYMVALTAIDPSGAADSILVTIMVLDGPDVAVITPGAAVNNAPAFSSDALSRSVDENMPAGTPVGAPVAATDDAGDTVTYTEDSGYFDIDGNGQLTTTMMLDYESMASHTVTITATDAGENTDTVTVTVTVGDLFPGCTVMDNNGLTNDCETLLAAKDTLGGSLDWSDNADNPITGWEGVTVSGDPGRVTRIWLRGKGLDGTIPASLGRLDMVTVLNLNENDLTGGIPDLSAMPLTELYSSQNANLGGAIPAWLGRMTDMTDLWIRGSGLTGPMPDLRGMTSLNIAKLQDNDLGTGSDGVPDGSMLPPNATWILLQNNGFGGTIPDLSGLNVKTLWLHSNGLTGSIDASYLPSSVTSLELRNNRLSGEIPDLSGLSNLVFLRLHTNDLTGAVPGTLGELANLQKLRLDNNELTGIDAGLENAADTLTHLFLAGNNFAEGTCLRGDLADVTENDFVDANLAGCP